MTAAALTRALPAGDRVLLDSTVLIAYLDGSEAVSAAATLVIDRFIRSGRNSAVISMVTLLEVLVKPARQSPGAYRHVHDFLQHFPNFRLQTIDFPVAQEAAHLRASQGIKTPDSLTIATGIVKQVRHLVSNDEKWRRVQDRRLHHIILKDHLPL